MLYPPTHPTPTSLSQSYTHLSLSLSLSLSHLLTLPPLSFPPPLPSLPKAGKILHTYVYTLWMGGHLDIRRGCRLLRYNNAINQPLSTGIIIYVTVHSCPTSLSTSTALPQHLLQYLNFLSIQHQNLS